LLQYNTQRLANLRSELGEIRDRLSKANRPIVTSSYLRYCMIQTLSRVMIHRYKVVSRCEKDIILNKACSLAVTVAKHICVTKNVNESFIKIIYYIKSAVSKNGLSNSW
jgi:hypothetical protein